MAAVSITRCGSYAEDEVYGSVKRSVDLLGGIDRFVKKGERILIKPNILTGKPPEAAVTTHPLVVKSVIRLVREAGGRALVGDSPGFGAPLKNAEKCGILRACMEAGAELIELKTSVEAENPGGRTFRRLEVAKEALDADGIINVPKLKTHAQMFLTLGVKNMFGCVVGKKKAQWHLSAGVDSLYFAGMLLDLYLLLKPRITIMDGIVAMEGNGPGSGDPASLGLVFASPEAVAMDAVITRALGADAEDMPVLKAANERGIMEADYRRASVLGEPLESVRVKGFRFAPAASTSFTASLPYFIDRPLRKALTSRPLVSRKSCVLCSVCVEVCPAGVMRKTTKIEIDYGRCIRCYCCQEMCPEGAISPKDGWLKRLIPGL